MFFHLCNYHADLPFLRGSKLSVKDRDLQAVYSVKRILRASVVRNRIPGPADSDHSLQDTLKRSRQQDASGSIVSYYFRRFLRRLSSHADALSRFICGSEVFR